MKTRPYYPRLGTLESAERNAIVKALDDNAGNRAAACKVLGVDITTLYRLIKRYGIPKVRGGTSSSIVAKCCICGTDIRRLRRKNGMVPCCGRKRCRDNYVAKNSLSFNYRLAFAPSNPEGAAVYLEQLGAAKFRAEWVALIVEQFGTDGRMRDLANALLVVKQRYSGEEPPSMPIDLKHPGAAHGQNQQPDTSRLETVGVGIAGPRRDRRNNG